MTEMILEGGVTRAFREGDSYVTERNISKRYKKKLKINGNFIFFILMGMNSFRILKKTSTPGYSTKFNRTYIGPGEEIIGIT